MPPKKRAQKIIKKKKNETQISEGDLKVSNVDKEYFTNQFNAKEKIIARLFFTVIILFIQYLQSIISLNTYIIQYRLKDKKIILENNINKFKKKTNDLNIKYKNEYESARTKLMEKNILEEKLKMEIKDLKQVWASILIK